MTNDVTTREVAQREASYLPRGLPRVRVSSESSPRIAQVYLPRGSNGAPQSKKDATTLCLLQNATVNSEIFGRHGLGPIIFCCEYS